MLQKFAERVGFGLATLVTSLLFLAIHVPGWMALHTFKAGTAATILIFGVVMAVVFKYADSLWGPIATHSANDCISFVLFGR
jgi:membrane protease YdiL (CAAX protease family)